MIAAGHDKVDLAELHEFVARFVAAWRARDPGAVAACCHPETVWEDPSIPGVLRGPDEVAEHVQTTLDAFSDLSFEPDGEPAVAADSTLAYWPWRMVGTNDGPIDPPGFPATGRTIEIPGINVWAFRDGALLSNRAVYDRARMAIQLGLMPAPRSRAEQLFVTMAQLRSRVRDE